MVKIKQNSFLAILFFLAVALQQDNLASAQPFQASTKFFTLQETVAKLLPNAQVLTRRDVSLTPKQLARLKKHRNWDSDTTQFVFYHARNKKKKIVRTLVLFKENPTRGRMVAAVALSNQGKVVDALLMEAQNNTINWIMPLLRADYMQTFIGKDKNLKLKLSKKFASSEFTSISQTYALLIANAVKKSAQLFHVVFNRK